jgi:hypothetical protein
MSIDKSLSQYYDVPGTKKIEGQLHKLAYITAKEAKALKKMGGIETRTPEGIPAYPGGAGTPGGYGGGPDMGGGGGGNGGHSGGHHQDTSASRRAQAATDAAAEQAKTDRLNEARANEARETAREKAIQTAAITTTAPTRSPHRDTPEQIEEQKKLDIEQDWEFQDRKAKAPKVLKPKTVTYDKGNPFTEKLIPTTVGQTLYNPKTSQNALLKRGSGIGGILKGFGTLAAGVLLPALLPAKAASAYKMYKTAKTVSAFANKFGIADKDYVKSLTSNLRSNINKDILKQTQKDDTPKVAEKAWGPQKYLQPDKKTTTDDTRDGINQIQEIKNLESTVSEGAQTFLSDEQKEQYQLVQNKMKAALADGSYIDKDGKHIDLSDEQVNALTQWITKINDMLVDPLPVGAAEGGRIDSPLMGGSRYI